MGSWLQMGPKMARNGLAVVGTPVISQKSTLRAVKRKELGDDAGTQCTRVTRHRDQAQDSKKQGKKCVKAQIQLSSPDGKGGWVPSRSQAQGRCGRIVLRYVYMATYST